MEPADVPLITRGSSPFKCKASMMKPGYSHWHVTKAPVIHCGERTTVRGFRMIQMFCFLVPFNVQRTCRHHSQPPKLALTTPKWYMPTSGNYNSASHPRNMFNSTDLNSSRLRSHNILASMLESQLYYPGIGLKCETIHIQVPLTSWHYYRCSQCIVNGSQKLQTHSDVKPREWLMHPQTGGEHCDQSHVLSWDPNSHKGRNQWSYQIVKAAKTAKKQTAFRKTNYFNHKWITRCKGFRESYRATSF